MRIYNSSLIAVCLVGPLLSGCATKGSKSNFTVPAEEYSRSVKEGTSSDFSFHRIKTNEPLTGPAATDVTTKRAALTSDPLVAAAAATTSPQLESSTISEASAKDGIRAQFTGDPRYTDRGLKLKKSVDVPSPQYVAQEGAAPAEQYPPPPGQSPQSPYAVLPPPLPVHPPGSSAPYHSGQMTANPSLWPDEARGAFLFTDHRGFQPMDIITIVIKESTQGNKKAETETEKKFNLTAGIAEFFGVETKEWAANNTSLDPANLITANTSSKFEGDGETKRQGSLNGQVSAVILEVLPNNVMRIEGTKIVSVDAEEEVLVLSGLVRPRDIDAENLVDSSRVANMRIDFYGRGVIGEQQSPGWGARIFQTIWPF